MLGFLGGGLALIGLLAFAAVMGMHFVIWQMAQPGADSAQMTEVLKRVHDTTGTVIPLGIVPYAAPAGLLVLAGGLSVARTAPVLAAAFVALAAVGLAIGFGTGSDTIAVIGGALLVVGLAWIGGIVARETDSAWEHPPEIRGFGAPAPAA